MLSALGRRERQHRALQTRLESHDIRRRLAAVRARLEAAATRLVAAARRRQDGARAQLATLSARIDSLSPLAVLGRGYAVCWNADRTRIIRDASAVAPGDDVRVRVQVGELFCRVKESAGDGHQ
jgi:exodeoxyribonuclease VII large subunit